jgi:hypothetical protein
MQLKIVDVVRACFSAGMIEASSFRRRLAGLALAALGGAGLLVGCGIITIDETTTGRLELEPALSCEEAAQEGKRLIGVHMRQSDASQQFELLSLTGTVRESRLPRLLVIDEVRTRLSATSDQEEGSTRSVTAAPRAGFSDGTRLPAVYDLSYRADEENYAGPLVVGNSAVGPELPTTGRGVFRGRVELTRITFEETGNTVASTAEAQFLAVVGFGSGSARFALSDVTTTSGPAFPFVSLEWRNLGVCGARVASTGQGTVRLVSEDGRLVSPFTDGRSLPVLLSSFEAVQFFSDAPPAPPGEFGGIFSIESDAGTLAAVFLSQGTP